jgi:hypothetical protein
MHHLNHNDLIYATLTANNNIIITIIIINNNNIVTCCVVRLHEIDATSMEVSLQGQQNFDRRDAQRRHEGRYQHL